MIGRRPTEARDLFDNDSLMSRFHHGVSRIQQLVKIPPPSVAAPTPMCSYESVFFRPQTLTRHGINNDAADAGHAAAASSSARAADQSDFILTGLDEVSMLVVSFLDGRSLGRMMLVSPAWHAYIMLHHTELFQNLLTREFDTVIPSSTIFKSYLLSLRHELDREIAHSVYVEITQSALERYCTTIRPENHGFVAMFCDIVRFRDPRIARFVADRRKGAMNMVLTATPQHVQAFRRECPDAGITSFVPIDNPYWPQFELPRVEFPGFLGYAFDHAEVVPGYEALKDTVIKSILKELMLFDTAENAAAYGAAVGKPPFAAIVGATEQAPPYHLTFSNPLREELRHLSITERIEALKQRRTAIDHSLSCCSRRTFTK